MRLQLWNEIALKVIDNTIGTSKRWSEAKIIIQNIICDLSDLVIINIYISY